MSSKNFMTLQKSRQRKSMEEFVSVVKAKRDDVMDKGKGFLTLCLDNIITIKAGFFWIEVLGSIPQSIFFPRLISCIFYSI